jgi:hypothetical protein
MSLSIQMPESEKNDTGDRDDPDLSDCLMVVWFLIHAVLSRVGVRVVRTANGLYD